MLKVMVVQDRPENCDLDPENTGATVSAATTSAIFAASLTNAIHLPDQVAKRNTVDSLVHVEDSVDRLSRFASGESFIVGRSATPARSRSSRDVKFTNTSPAFGNTSKW